MNVRKNLIFNSSKLIKRLFRINDVSLFRKRIKKRLGKLLFKKSYGPLDVVKVMEDLGMTRGSVVCIHASMMEFYNYIGTTNDLIKEILKVIGEDGTLMMPAFPEGATQENYIFNPLTAKTKAGALAEAFRTYPGVKRSNNVRHSVCAYGKYADFLTKDHTKGNDCWDKYSPYYRLYQLNGLVFNLGMPRSYMGTFFHCVESILQYEHPYWKQFFNKKRVYHYLDNNGAIKEYINIDSDLYRKTRKRNVTKYFTKEDWRIRHLSNLEIKVYYVKDTIEKMLELGRKGISVYYIPNPKEYEF